MYDDKCCVLFLQEKQNNNRRQHVILSRIICVYLKIINQRNPIAVRILPWMD